MSKQIQGIVRGNPIFLENCCFYIVEDGDGLYLVLSTGQQACKDSVFVAEGQRMQIKGNAVENLALKGIIHTKEAQIKWNRNIAEPLE